MSFAQNPESEGELVGSRAIAAMNNFSTKPFNVGVSVGYNSFQNQKESLMRYDGLSFGAVLGYKIPTKNWVWDINGSYHMAKTQGVSSISSASQNHTAINTSFLYKLKRFDDSWDFFSGVDLGFENLNRENELLGNNSNYEYFQIPFSISFLMQGMVKGRPFQATLSQSLFGYVADSQSFLYPFPLNYIKEGHVDYNGNSDVLSYGEMAFINSFSKTNLTLSYDLFDYLKLSYNWRFSYYEQISNYPVAFANHALQISWTFGEKTTY